MTAAVWLGVALGVTVVLIIALCLAFVVFKRRPSGFSNSLGASRRERRTARLLELRVPTEKEDVENPPPSLAHQTVSSLGPLPSAAATSPNLPGRRSSWLVRMASRISRASTASGSDSPHASGAELPSPNRSPSNINSLRLEQMMHVAAPNEKVASFLKFEYVKLLGRGTEGAAHLMRNGDGSEHVVIKVTKLTPSDHEESDVAAVQTEVGILAQLNHPHVVAYRGSMNFNHQVGPAHAHHVPGPCSYARRVPTIPSPRRHQPRSPPFPDSSLFSWSLPTAARSRQPSRSGRRLASRSRRVG